MEGGRVVDSLMRPGAYDEPVRGKIRLIQTHISWVFLTGDFVYKIKKPVDFGFLDFTTLEKRKKYLELELRLNRRLCPGIYLSVLPVREEKGKLKVNGKGRTVEYVLKMKQLPQERLMDGLLERGEVGRDGIDRIAGRIADFHRNAETSREISEFGRMAKFMVNWNENFGQVEQFVPEMLSREELESSRRSIEGFVKDNRELFEKRVENGMIKRIHGDLHSGNIFIVDGKPFIFDCIEFNMRFSCSDVAADVAFLSMDLEYRGRKDLSERFVEKYMEFSGDREVMKVLNFYKAYYAWVRGKVTAFRLLEGTDSKEKKDVKSASISYLELSMKYMKELNNVQ